MDRDRDNGRGRDAGWDVVTPGLRSCIGRGPDRGGARGRRFRCGVCARLPLSPSAHSNAGALWGDGRHRDVEDSARFFQNRIESVRPLFER